MSPSGTATATMITKPSVVKFGSPSWSSSSGTAYWVGQIRTISGSGQSLGYFKLRVAAMGVGCFFLVFLTGSPDFKKWFATLNGSPEIAWTNPGTGKHYHRCFVALIKNRLRVQIHGPSYNRPYGASVEWKLTPTQKAKVAKWLGGNP